MPTPQQLLQRLDAIGQSLAQTGQALALLGLGSVGQELERLDNYSDLDFFAIVQTGHKQRFLDQLDWLEQAHPIAYAFANTADGCKLLFADGIYGEYAVFEPAELTTAVYTAARLVWHSDQFDPTLAHAKPLPTPTAPTIEWQIGEAITNLYVGLTRYRRGEKLSAFRFIQQYAVDRVIALSAQVADEQAARRDPFSRERRYEQRFPDLAPQLSSFMQGYDHSVASAEAILNFLTAHFAVNPAMQTAVDTLLQQESG